MKDDGIAIMVLENLRSQLESMGIEVIIGETDFETCFHQLNEDDFIIIVDAVYKGLSVGKIHTDNLHNAITVSGRPNGQHDASILDLMSLYGKSLKGYLIGIEIAEIGIGNKLSEPLKKEFNGICFEIKRIIKKIVGCDLGEVLLE